MAQGVSRSLYIIAGCNGAGKTTASYSVLPYSLNITEFVNADEIARGLSPFNPEGMAIKAGRLMLERIDELIKQGVSFAIETTLATRSYINLVREAHRRGYMVYVLFFYLKDVALACRRVAERVAHGGHDIPQNVIERRYKAGLRNLLRLYAKEVDRWSIYDNSESRLCKIAEGGCSIGIVPYDEEKFKNIKAYE